MRRFFSINMILACEKRLTRGSSMTENCRCDALNLGSKSGTVSSSAIPYPLSCGCSSFSIILGSLMEVRLPTAISLSYDARWLIRISFLLKLIICLPSLNWHQHTQDEKDQAAGRGARQVGHSSFTSIHWLRHY
jgi:hypothetical protein